ncbi:MAG TPA: GNAT family N-acetyltransferase [Acidimicrobiales bacterium]
MKGTTIRPADKGDLEFLVWVMQEAATSHLDRCVWDVLLGTPPDETRAVLESVATSAMPHWCHLDRFLVAEVDGEPVAAASSYDPSAEGNDPLADAVLEALAPSSPTNERLAAILERADVLDGATPKPYVDAWAIENVAVAPAHRGRGLVDALFEVILEEARDRGREHLQIMCLDGNVRAQRAWERNGFEEVAAYRSRAFRELYGCDGLKLLVRRP